MDWICKLVGLLLIGLGVAWLWAGAFAGPLLLFFLGGLALLLAAQFYGARLMGWLW